jgi:PAS domain S-box-containing protein
MEEDPRRGDRPTEEGEELYKTLAEATFEGIMLSSDGIILEANEAMADIGGYSREELRGKNFFDLILPDDLPRVVEAVKGASEEPYLVRGMRKDGTVVNVEVRGKMMPYKGQTVRVSAVRDISRQRQQEEALRRSEELYRLLAENVDDVIFTVDSELNFSYVSPSVERATGFSVEETMAMGWQDFLAPASLERVMEVLADDVLGITGKEGPTDRSLVLDVELNRKDGGTLWSEINITAVKDASGAVEKLLGVARDTTERRRAHEQFLEEKKRSELYLDLFGHDIRNINQGIMSYLELMLMNPSIAPRDSGYIKNVLEQATRINDLVAKVQRLTQLRTVDVRIQDVEASVMIRGAVDFVTAKYPERNVRVNVDTGCEGHVVRGSNLLHDVFKSILDNSVRFDRHDEVVIDISCTSSKDGQHVRFAFDDRGPGIPDAMKDQVFRRLDLGEGIRGSGLGLTVVWEIVKRLDGQVWVEDRVQGDHTQGSRFVVELPRDGA